MSEKLVALCNCDWVRFLPCPEHAALLTDAEAEAAEARRLQAVIPQSQPEDDDFGRGWKAAISLVRDELESVCDVVGLKFRRAAVGVPAPRPQIVKHRSGCKAWTADRAHRWQEGDQATCNCGAWRNWLEQDPAEVGVPAPPSWTPLCQICRQFAAVCFGVYEDPTGRLMFTCGSCCAHGNEDGWCQPISEFQDWLDMLMKETEAMRDKLAAAGVPARRDTQQEPDCGLTANDIYHVMQAWEQQPASDEQTRIVIGLGKLRDAFIKRGDSQFVTPLSTDTI